LHVVVGCPDAHHRDSLDQAAACELGRAGRDRAAARLSWRAHLARPEMAVTTEVWHGDLGERGVVASRDAGLVVVTGGRAAGDTVLSAVAGQVAAHAGCPTIVVPPGVGSPADGPVVLGVCALEGEDRATAFAFEEAALRGAALHAVHVWAGIPPAAYDCVYPFAYDLRSACATADRLLAEELAGWAEKYPEVRVERQSCYDVNPAQSLLRLSHAAGMVVIGARRPAVPSAMLLGTVARTLIAGAACPVAVVRLGG
ncbi:MAG TPA: universal stress protein, partial [Pilimelia sp.]|nr:universal stress protein [Pilimelia sp.]